jgi:hypothetical protein
MSGSRLWALGSRYYTNKDETDVSSWMLRMAWPSRRLTFS